MTKKINIAQITFIILILLFISGCNTNINNFEETIIYVSNQDFNEDLFKDEIYQINSKGQSQTRVTYLEQNISIPDLSPNSEKIVFSLETEESTEIFVIDLGKVQLNLTQLTHSGFRNYRPKWSPDGSMIVFSSNMDGNSEVYIMNADGSNTQRLTNHPTFDGHPDWSPDGEEIVFTSTRDSYQDAVFLDFELYIMGADGSNIQRITHIGSYDQFPRWSPDGNFIAFLSSREAVQGYTVKLFILNLQTGEVTHVIDDTDPNYPSPEDPSRIAEWGQTWSPDGQYIAVTIYGDIYKVNVQDGSFELLIENGGYPSWRD